MQSLPFHRRVVVAIAEVGEDRELERAPVAIEQLMRRSTLLCSTCGRQT